MAARKSTRVNRKYQTKYRVTNWREHTERGLRSRGDITVWFSDEAGEAWTPPNIGTEGPPRRPAALLESGNRDGVDTAHGLSSSAPTDRGIPRLVVAVDGARPESTGPHQPSRRNKDVDVPSPTRAHAGALHLIVDSAYAFRSWCGVGPVVKPG